MKTTELTNKEINLLIEGLFARFSYEQLESNNSSLASKLLDKLFDARDEIKKNKNNE